MVLAALDCHRLKNENRLQYTTLHRTQFHIDQGPQYDTQYPEYDKSGHTL